MNNLNDFKRTLNAPDFSVIQNVYFKISLKAFKECFTNLTRRNSYYDNVYNILVDIAALRFPETPRKKLEEILTVGTMIWIAEVIFRRNDKVDCSEETALFIIERLVAEPICILGKELHKEKTN